MKKDRNLRAADEATERVLEIFDQINMVPRQSLHLEKITAWLLDWAKEHELAAETDDAGNILIRVPASPGFEDAPVVILQGHMDMVCEKRPDVVHDFQNDPVISWRDGEWLRAKGTSLGADNGIALALFFDLVTDPQAEHPSLEILITSDEETGLVGAQNLAQGWLKGSILLNLDSEDEGIFTVGCAGGMDTNLYLPVGFEDVPDDYRRFKVIAGGLEGGHSGIEIHLGKANANVLLVRALNDLMESVEDVRIGCLDGGTAHNAIPRQASACIALPAGREKDAEKILSSLEEDLKNEFAAVEKSLFVSLENTGASGCSSFFEPAQAQRVIDALRLIPHGVKAMSAEIEGVVDTSMNFAVLRTAEAGKDSIQKKGMVKVLTNRRSAVMSRGSDFSQIMFSLARLYGGTWEVGNEYPPWEPDTSSDVLMRSKRVWKELFGKEAEVEVTHAGLECGAIGACYPGLQMISFGPTILQPHSPDERMLIPSVGRTRTFLRELFKSYLLA